MASDGLLVAAPARKLPKLIALRHAPHGAGLRTVDMNPGFNVLHSWLAAPLAKRGRIDEARASAARADGSSIGARRCSQRSR